MTTPADELRTAADELRTAADKLRALTKAIDAPDLPDQSWHVEACASAERGDCPCIVAQGVCNTDGPVAVPVYYVADAETPECAAYIAAMGPPVALALVDWLETAAKYADKWPADHQANSPFRAGALAVAHAINGSQP